MPQIYYANVKFGKLTLFVILLGDELIYRIIKKLIKARFF